MLYKTIIPLKMYDFEESVKRSFEFALQGVWRKYTLYEKTQSDMFSQIIFDPYSNRGSLQYSIFLVNCHFIHAKLLNGTEIESSRQEDLFEENDTI